MGKWTWLWVVVLVGVFGGGFLLLNRAVFQMNLSATTQLPALSDRAPIPREEVALVESPSFAFPQLTIREGEFSEEVPDGALSMEEAAMIGARYLWELLGVDLDGGSLNMSFGGRNWHGEMMHEFLHGQMSVYRFILHGERGELLNLMNQPIDWYSPREISGYIWDYRRDWVMENGHLEPEALFPNYEEMQEVATQIARRFYPEGVLDVRFFEVMPEIFKVLENGEIAVASFRLVFVFSSEDRGSYWVTLDSETGELLLFSMETTIVPSYE